MLGVGDALGREGKGSTLPLRAEAYEGAEFGTVIFGVTWPIMVVSSVLSSVVGGTLGGLMGVLVVLAGTTTGFRAFQALILIGQVLS